MAVVLGKDVDIYIYDGGTWKVCACGQSCEINTNTEMIETSQAGSGIFASFLPGKISGSCSISGVVFLALPGKLEVADIRQKQFAGQLLLVRFQRYDIDGSYYYSDEFSAYISSVSDTGDFKNIATFSINLQITGPITQIYVPTPSTASKMYRFQYTGIGGEVSFSNAALINKDVQIVTNDGIAFSKLITGGTPIDKEVKYTDSTGTIEFAIPLATGQEIVVNYQDL